MNQNVRNFKIIRYATKNSSVFANMLFILPARTQLKTSKEHIRNNLFTCFNGEILDMMEGRFPRIWICGGWSDPLERTTDENQIDKKHLS